MLAVQEAVARREDDRLLLLQRRDQVDGERLHEPAQQYDAALRARQPDRLVERRARVAADALQRHVGAPAVGGGLDPLGEIVGLRREGFVGTQAQGHLSLVGMTGRDQHLAGAHRPRRGHRGQPDVAGAQHEHRLAARQLPPADAVDRYRQRLHEPGGLPGYAVRDRVAAGRAPSDELGVATAAWRVQVRALHELARTAVPAATAGQALADVLDGHPLPDQARVDALADLDHLARDLVPDVNLIGRRVPGVEEQVGPADPRAADARQGVARAERRRWDLRQLSPSSPS